MQVRASKLEFTIKLIAAVTMLIGAVGQFNAVFAQTNSAPPLSPASPIATAPP